MPQEITRKSLEEVSGEIVQLLQTLYTATKTVHIYPPENPSVVRMIDGAHEAITKQIPIGGALDLSYMEEKLIVNGEMLDDFLQKRGIIKNFHELMKQRRVSSITFWDGVTKDELRDFLLLLGTKAASLGSKDDAHEKLEELMEEKRIERIEVDEQIFVAISKREKVVDARAAVAKDEDSAVKVLKDEVFSRFLAGEISAGDVGVDGMQLLISDPDRMVEMVQGVIADKGWGEDIKTLPYRVDETRAILERMSSLVEQVDDPLVRSKMNREISKITSQIDTPDLTDMILTSAGVDSATPGEMPKVILPLLGDQKLTAVVEGVVGEYQRLEKLEESDEWPSRRTVALKSILVEARSMTSGGLAGQLDGLIREDGASAAKFEDRAQVLGLKLGKSLEAGGSSELCDIALGPVLVTTARYLFENGADELGAYVLEKLAEKFHAQSPDAKAVAAQQISRLFRFMRENGKEAYIGDLGRRREGGNQPGAGRSQHLREHFREPRACRCRGCRRRGDDGRRPVDDRFGKGYREAHVGRHRQGSPGGVHLRGQGRAGSDNQGAARHGGQGGTRVDRNGDRGGRQRDRRVGRRILERARD